MPQVKLRIPRMTGYWEYKLDTDNPSSVGTSDTFLIAHMKRTLPMLLLDNAGWMITDTDEARRRELSLYHKTLLNMQKFGEFV